MTRAGESNRREALLALALFAALTVLHTWPLARAPWRLALDSHDAGHTAWTLAWIVHQLPRHPTAVYDTNTFWPETGTLTYADPMFVPALVALPIRAFGGSAMFALNVTVLAGLTLTAWCTWFVVRDWTGRASAGLVAGALAAYNVHTLTRLPHAVATCLWTLPLILLLSDRLIDRPSGRDAVGLALLILATAAISIYWLALAGAIVAVVLGVGLVTGRRRGVFRGAAASGAGLLLAAPILWPYAKVAAGGVTRPVEVVMQFVATPAGYLASISRVHRGWTSMFFRDEVNLWFAGVTALVLAAAGLVAARRMVGGPRRVVILVALAAIGVILSLGPVTVVYRVLYNWLPPMRGLRVAARFGYLYLLAVAMAASCGVAWLSARLPARRRALVVGVILAAVTIEAWHAPVRVRAYDGVPPIYEVVRDLPDPVRLVEVPFFPPDAMHENSEYIVNSTVHWRPLLNGYSGFTPDSYRRRTESIWFFPEPWTVDAIRREGATHVMVHLERFGGEADDVRRALPLLAGLELLAADGYGHRLYRVR